MIGLKTTTKGHTPLLSKYGKWLCLFAIAFSVCTDTPDNCGQGRALNVFTEFCFSGEIYQKCGGEDYDPTAQFCHDRNLHDRCGGNIYDPVMNFCAVNVIHPKCAGETFDPTVEGCIHNSELWRRCGRNFFDDAIEFCHNGNMVFRKCANPNFNYNTFDPQYGCNGVPQLPTCGGTEYDPNLIFCYYDDSERDFKTELLCGNSGEFEPNTQFCFASHWVYDKCNGRIYNPLNEQCENINVDTRPVCGDVHFDIETNFCHGNIIYEKCGNDEYNPETHNCVNEEIVVPPTTFLVTVSSTGTGATGGDSYAQGATVNITAGTAPEGYAFTNWTTTSLGVTFANAKDRKSVV